MQTGAHFGIVPPLYGHCSVKNADLESLPIIFSQGTD